MAKKPVTPNDMAKMRAEKKTYALYLTVSTMEKIDKMRRTSGVPISNIVDQAIAFYIETIEESESNSKQK